MGNAGVHRATPTRQQNGTDGLLLEPGAQKTFAEYIAQEHFRSRDDRQPAFDAGRALHNTISFQVSNKSEELALESGQLQTFCSGLWKAGKLAQSAKLCRKARFLGAASEPLGCNVLVS